MDRVERGDARGHARDSNQRTMQQSSHFLLLKRAESCNSQGIKHKARCYTLDGEPKIL